MTASFSGSRTMRDIILQLLQLQPFRPFRLRLTCGAVHEVHDPALARLTPFTLRLGCLDTNATPPAVVDQFIISLDHVVSLEPLDVDEPIVVPASPTP